MQIYKFHAQFFFTLSLLFVWPEDLVFIYLFYFHYLFFGCFEIFMDKICIHAHEWMPINRLIQSKSEIRMQKRPNVRSIHICYDTAYGWKKYFRKTISKSMKYGIDGCSSTNIKVILTICQTSNNENEYINLIDVCNW